MLVHIVTDNKGTFFTVQGKQNRTDANLKDTMKQTAENRFGVFQKVFINKNVTTTVLFFKQMLILEICICPCKGNISFVSAKNLPLIATFFFVIFCSIKIFKYGHQ